MPKQLPVLREDVLRAFAMEFAEGAGILQRYLNEYPQYSLDLVDLSRELSRQFDEAAELTAEDLRFVNSGVERFRVGRVTVHDLEAATAKRFTDAAIALNIPLQAGIAFRERRVEVSTVPARFLAKFASALQASIATLESFLALPPAVSLARANKSVEKPTAAQKVSFERVLTDAGVSQERLAELLSQDE
jgi:hypothetical protein